MCISDFGRNVIYLINKLLYTVNFQKEKLYKSKSDYSNLFSLIVIIALASFFIFEKNRISAFFISFCIEIFFIFLLFLFKRPVDDTIEQKLVARRDPLKKSTPRKLLRNKSYKFGSIRHPNKYYTISNKPVRRLVRRNSKEQTPETVFLEKKYSNHKKTRKMYSQKLVENKFAEEKTTLYKKNTSN